MLTLSESGTVPRSVRISIHSRAQKYADTMVLTWPCSNIGLILMCMLLRKCKCALSFDNESCASLPLYVKKMFNSAIIKIPAPHKWAPLSISSWGFSQESVQIK